MAAQMVAGSVLTRLKETIDPRVHDGDGTFLPETALRAVGDLIGCDEISFQVMDARRARCVLQTVSDADDDEDVAPLFWAAFWSSACSYPQRSGDYETVTRRSDFYGQREFDGTAMSEYFTQVGLRHELMVPLPPDGALDRRILLFRSNGPDFSDADVLTMSILRPHLFALHQRQGRRRAGIAELTPRQMQVLTMVAAGCSSVQVARALSVSPATVTKHLENIYGRLDVSSRTAAVAKVIPLTTSPNDLLTG